jgi:excisionase family DNA binding protein
MSEETPRVEKVAGKAVYAIARQGELPACQVRHQWRFRRTKIDGWMALQVVQTAKMIETPWQPREGPK